MRDFTSQDFSAVVSEIYRDLSKAPKVLSTRVQNREHEKLANEALNYAYQVSPEILGYPNHEMLSATLEQFLIEMAAYSDFYKNPKNVSATLEWFRGERRHRFSIGFPSPRSHPELKSYLEGNEFSYTYGDRLVPQWAYAVRALTLNEGTRRCYVSVWDQPDIQRSSLMSRVPCSIGYHFLIRPTPLGDRLHATYFQRSCDFEIFWVTDLLFAIEAMRFMKNELRMVYPDLKLGVLTHNIISFHQFFDPEEEEVF